jgi:hypothetical protein
MFKAGGLVVALAVFAWSCRSADRTPTTGLSVDVTYTVDTTSAEHREVLALWRSYLAAQPRNFGKKTPLWSSAEQAQWKLFDIGGGFAYAEVNDTRATVFHLSPARPGDSTEYLIRTLFTSPDSFQKERRTFMHRVYAMREDGRWVLSSALSRTTADWKKTTIERITYVHPPDHVVDTVRARMAIRFVDSLAVAFDAPKPPAITYYLARSPEEAFSLNGIDFYLPGSRAYAGVANYQVFSGLPKFGEFYPHELTHMVLGWILPDLGTPQVLDEALALWIGGGRELTWPQIKKELAAALRKDSSWTLDRILEDRPATAIYRLSAAAALLELAHQRGGMPALKVALNPPRKRDVPDLVEGAAKALNVSRSQVETLWRKSVLDATVSGGR